MRDAKYTRKGWLVEGKREEKRGELIFIEYLHFLLILLNPLSSPARSMFTSVLQMRKQI